MLKNGFYELLHRRGETLESLAAALGTTHSHLSQVFAGKRGKHTRKHIVKLLTEEEVKLLGWTETGAMKPEVIKDGPTWAEVIENLTEDEWSPRGPATPNFANVASGT